MKISQIYNYLIDFILPNRCGFCGEVIEWNKLACPECVSQITLSENPVKYDENHNFTLCVSACDYVGVPRLGILNLKYYMGLNCAKYLSPYLAQAVERYIELDGNTLVTCVPMSRKRRRAASYNHAERVGLYLSRELALPFDARLLKKSDKSALQHELNASQRKKAAVGKYSKGSSHRDISGKTVIIADDVITTGSTLSECARALKLMGAERVYCVTLAKTVYEKERSEPCE